MKKNKILYFLCLLILICFSLQGCKSPFVTYRFPGGQPNSVWSTKDNSIVFYVGNNLIDPIYGEMETADGSVEIEICMSDLDTGVQFHHKKDGITPESDFAYGHGKVISRKVYQVEITSADAYFETGQILTFYRIQEGDSSVVSHGRAEVLLCKNGKFMF